MIPRVLHSDQSERYSTFSLRAVKKCISELIGRGSEISDKFHFYGSLVNQPLFTSSAVFNSITLGYVTTPKPIVVRRKRKRVPSEKKREIDIGLEKWFPLWGERAHSLKLFCMYDKRFEI